MQAGSADDNGYIPLKKCLTNEKVSLTLKSFTMTEIVAFFVEVIAADNQIFQTVFLASVL